MMGSIRYGYASRGNICKITDQSGNSETFRYDKEGRQVQHTDRMGTVTETRYNIYGQPTMQTCTNSKDDRHVMGTWEYDSFGRLKKSVAGGFFYTYEYRPDGKLLNKWSSGKQVISCDYYKNGSLKSLTDVSGKTLYYGYDINGRLETLKNEAGHTLTEYAYTAAGRIKQIRSSNGITTSYEYDSDGNISRLTIGDGTEEGLFYDAFMLYDLNGNRLGKTGHRMGVEGKQEMNTVFCYDSMNRLTMENRREGGEKYAYDLCGNRLRKQRYHYALTADSNMDSVIDDEESYCYNERNELTQRSNLQSVTEYIYDENGSLIREKEGEKETGYRYDLLNRQTHVQLPDERIQENLYDGEGLRAGLTENGKSTTFLFYNGEILAECNGDGMPIRRHVRGLGLSHMQTLSDDVYHMYHQDEQGSTAYITGIKGETENLYSYDAFGNLIERKESIGNRILYTGQQYDQETDQYYLRARYYNPVIGRFTQEDTYRGDGLNLYTYCANNPVMYYDLSGHDKATRTNNTPSGTPASGIDFEGGRETELFLPDEYYQKLDDNIAKAIAARDAEVARIQTLSNNQQSNIATVVAGVDLRTGDVYVGVKDSKIYKGNATCAEDIVFRGLGGNTNANIIMTPAIRPRNNEVIPVCTRCQTKYPKNQFMEGTKFQ